MQTSTNFPTVMSIAGNDPTGGAGLAADIEAISSQGCYPLPVVTCLTVQDTCDIAYIEALDAELVVQQARAVLEDVPVDAIKIGLLGNEEIIVGIHQLLSDYPEIPVVLDPILVSGGGSPVVSEIMIEAMTELLFPYTNILTPNNREVLALVPGADSIQSATMILQEMGCEYILVTGTHDNTSEVINRLYGQQRELGQYAWPRLPHDYHGSGCTLSAALAGLLAHGTFVSEAVRQAQDYTWRSLRAGCRIGMGQHHPNRLFWATESEEESPAENG